VPQYVRGAVEKEKRAVTDQQLQAPCQAFEASLSHTSHTPLKHLTQPSTCVAAKCHTHSGFIGTAFALAAVPCQPYSACYSLVRGSARLRTPHLARTRRPHRPRILLCRSFGPRTHEDGSTPTTVSLLVLSFPGLLHASWPIPTCPRF